MPLLSGVVFSFLFLGQAGSAHKQVRPTSKFCLHANSAYKQILPTSKSCLQAMTPPKHICAAAVAVRVHKETYAGHDVVQLACEHA